MLVIWKLDRLGRTVKGLVDFVADLQEQKIQFRSLTDGIDTTTPAGRFFFHIMASLAQMERELLAERTRAGLAAARRRGRVGGRKRRMTPGKVESARKLLKERDVPRDVARVSASRSRRCTAGFPLRLGEHPRHDASPPAGWPCGRPLGPPRLNNEILCKAFDSPVYIPG